MFLSSEGTKFTTTQTNVAVNNVDQVFIAANSLRVGIIFTPANLVRITYSALGVAVLDQGITVQAAGVPFYLDESQMGALVTQAWRAIASAVGPTTVSVFEILRQ